MKQIPPRKQMTNGDVEAGLGERPKIEANSKVTQGMEDRQLLQGTDGVAS